MKQILVAAAAVVVGFSASSVFAGGIIRNPGVSTQGHSAVSVGNQLGSYSGNIFANESLALPNPTKLGQYPFLSATGANFGLYTDVDANPGATATNAYKSSLAAGVTNFSQANYYNWFLGAGTSSRNILINNSALVTPVDSYVGNTETFTMNRVGVGNYVFNVTIRTTVTDGATPGYTNVVSTFSVSRVYNPALSFETQKTIDNGNPISISVGTGVDLNPGTLGANVGGVIQQDQSGTQMSTSITGGIRKITYTAGDGTVGEHIALNPQSYSSDVRSSSAGAGLNGTLAGVATALNNTVAGQGDYMSGFLFTGTFGAVSADSPVTAPLTYYTAFSIGGPAVIPEPASLGLFAPAAMLLARRRR